MSSRTSEGTSEPVRDLASEETGSHRLLLRLRETNPVFWKDLTITLRTPMYLGTVALATATLALFAAGIGVELFRERQDFGATARNLFEIVLGGAALVMALVGSNLSAGAIAQEREARTLDPLTLSALGPRRIVIGKFGATFVATALVTLAALPVLLPIVSLGGIPLSVLAVATAGQLAFGAVVVAAGLALSAHAESTRRISLLAVVLTLSGTLFTGAFLAAFSDAFRAGSTFHIKGPYFFSEAYFIVPLSAKYVLGLVALPAYLVGSVLSLCYLTARAGLMAPSEDRTFGIKCWAAASTSLGGGLVALSMRALHVSESDTRDAAAAWAVATALLALSLVFVFVGEPIAPSRRAELHPPRGLERLFQARLAPSILSVLVGTSVALPIGVAAITGLDSDFVGRAIWGAAYVGAIGGVMGLVAATAPSRPILARGVGVLALCVSGIGAPLFASGLNRYAWQPATINAWSPGWVIIHEHFNVQPELMAFGTSSLALIAVLAVTLMFNAASRQRKRLAQRPAV